VKPPLNNQLPLLSFRLKIRILLFKFRTRFPRSFGTDPAIKRNTSKVAMVKEGVLHQPSAEKDLRGGCMHTYVCISWWYLQVWNHRGGAKQKQKQGRANTQRTTLGATWESWGTLWAKRGGDWVQLSLAAVGKERERKWEREIESHALNSIEATCFGGAVELRCHELLCFYTLNFKYNYQKLSKYFTEILYDYLMACNQLTAQTKVLSTERFYWSCPVNLWLTSTYFRSFTHAKQ